jgi:hypothetical protein
MKKEEKFFPRKKWYVPRKTFVVLNAPKKKLEKLEEWRKRHDKIDLVEVDFKRGYISLFNWTLHDEIKYGIKREPEETNLNQTPAPLAAT